MALRNSSTWIATLQGQGITGSGHHVLAYDFLGKPPRLINLRATIKATDQLIVVLPRAWLSQLSGYLGKSNQNGQEWLATTIVTNLSLPKSSGATASTRQGGSMARWVFVWPDGCFHGQECLSYTKLGVCMARSAFPMRILLSAEKFLAEFFA